MKENAIFIDLRNIEQVRWWNKTAHKLVRVVRYETIVETATNKPVGYVVAIKSLFRKYVIKKNMTFLKDPKKVIITIKK